MNALKNDPLGMRAIDTVKQSDAKEWAIRMSEKGYAYKTILQAFLESVILHGDTRRLYQKEPV